MKQLIAIILFLFSVNAFALTESEINHQIVCKTLNESNFNQCTDSIFSKSTGSIGVLKDSLMTPALAAVSSSAVQVILNTDDVTINASEKKTVVSKLMTLFLKGVLGIASILLTWNCIHLLYSLMTEEVKESDQEYESWLGWYLLNSSITILNISSLSIIFAAVFAGKIIDTHFFIKYVVPLFESTAAFDEQAYYQRAYLWSSDITKVIFSDAVLIASQTSETATKLAMQSGAVQRQLNGLGVVYKETDLARCLGGQAKPDAFSHESLVDGRVALTQACLRGVGYTAFTPGAVRYNGVDREVQAVLVELNQHAREFEFEARKLACTKALPDDEARFKYVDHLFAYESCVNKTLEGAFLPNADGSIGFLPVSKKDYASLSDLQKQYQKIASEKLTRLFVEKARKESSAKSDGSSDFTIWMWKLFNQQSGYVFWKSETKEELGFITSNSTKSLFASNSILGKVEAKAKDISDSLSGNINEYRFIDYSSFLNNFVQQNQSKSADYAKTAVLTVVNYFAADMADTQAMNLKNCFAPGESCYSPFVNQFSSMTVNAVLQAQTYLEYYIALKLLNEGIKAYDETSSFVKSSSLALGATGFAMMFSVVKAVTSLMPFFVFGTLMLYYPLKSIYLTFGYGIDSLLMLVPRGGMKYQRSFNTELLNQWSAALWFLISGSVIIAMFLVVCAAYSICIVILNYISFVITSSLIVSNGDFINSSVSYIVNVMIFQMLDIILMVSLCKVAVRIIFNFQKALCPAISVNGFADKVNRKINMAMSKAKGAIR